MINPKEDKKEENEKYRTSETRIQIILWSISYINCK